MNDLAVGRGIRFIVLLIPTKELVFGRMWDKASPAYRELIENEMVLWEHTKQAFETSDIEYVDALPALRRQLTGGAQPYQVSHDGHPNQYGHRAIAKLVAAYLKEG